MKTGLHTVSILLGFMVMLVPRAASSTSPNEFDDVMESLEIYSSGDSYDDNCPARVEGARAFKRFTLIISYGNYRIIYTDRDYLSSPVGCGGRELIIKIDSNGLIEI